MKKFVGLLLSLALVMAFVPGAQAAGVPEIRSVTAPQIDNLIYEYSETVRVECANTELTETGVEVDVMHSNGEEISNLRIIDDTTIEFDLKMFNQPDFINYGLRLSIPDENGVRHSIFKGNCIEVRSGHMIFDKNPISAGELASYGLIIKLTSPPYEDFNGDIHFDGVKVNHSKISEEVFRAYPDIDDIAEKSEVEIRFYYRNTFYRKTLKITEDEIWIEPHGIPRTEPVGFYLNTANLELPEDEGDLSLVITGKGRYIDIDDITIEDAHRLRADTTYGLVPGTYNVAVTWTGLDMTYNVPLLITRSAVQSDVDLDDSLEEGVFTRYGGFDFTMTENITQKYLGSEKKTIDFSDRPLEDFYLLIPVEQAKMLVGAGTGLKILFEDGALAIPSAALADIPDRDLYIVAEGGIDENRSEPGFHSVSKGVYFDSNMTGFEFSKPVPNNLFSYEGVQTGVEMIDGSGKTGSAFVENGLMKTVVGETGTYMFRLEGMNFSDVADSYWGAEYIDALSALGIIDGMGDGTFLPEGMVTNAQFAKLVCETVGLTATEYKSYFADVDKNGWYYGYVCAAEEAGLVEGTYFNPDKPIKRLEMAKMVTKAYEHYTNCDISQIAAGSDDAFTDIAGLSISDREYVKAAYGLGIINGMTQYKFSPEGNATRSQAAAMIFRLLESMGIE